MGTSGNRGCYRALLATAARDSCTFGESPDRGRRARALGPLGEVFVGAAVERPMGSRGRLIADRRPSGARRWASQALDEAVKRARGEASRPSDRVPHRAIQGATPLESSAPLVIF